LHTLPETAHISGCERQLDSQIPLILASSVELALVWHISCLKSRVRFGVCVLLLFLTRLLQAESVWAAVSELPIQFRDGLLWVDVIVPQSTEPLNFLLDTGASASVINLNTARRLNLKLGRKVSVTGVHTTLTGYWPLKLTTKVDQIALPDEYLALDLSKLSDACSRSVDGLIGADFFCDRVVQIDYGAQKLRVLNTALRDAGTNSVPLEVRPCGLRVPVNVNGGKSQWVRVDTGCASAFQWVTSKVRAELCTSKLAVGLTELSIPQTMTGVQLGSSYLDTVPTGLHSKAIFPGESGLLGNGLLAQFGIITIDAKSGRLFLGRPSP
jgi:hypothetical protein